MREGTNQFSYQLSESTFISIYYNRLKKNYSKMIFLLYLTTRTENYPVLLPSDHGQLSKWRSLDHQS